jgi:ADP-ribose pyrophosphatase YjhB (NUDIX family)
MHCPGTQFNALWEQDGPSNAFAYHINILLEDGLIEKTDNKYYLTHEGKKMAAYIDGETGNTAKAPLLTVAIVVVDKEKTLMMRRTKEPFYGYWGFPAGKVKFSQYLLECAREELMEETGLECDLEMKGLFSSKTFSAGELSYNHQMFVVKGTNPRGTLIEKTREGENCWIAFDDILKHNTFPNIHYTLQMALGEGFRWVEADREQKADEFINMTERHNMKF